jgi:hypothetical protein
MRLWTLLRPVLLAKGLLNFVQRRAAFRGGLTFPEHHESLSAHCAVGFRISACALAKNLHIPASSPVNFSSSRD